MECRSQDSIARKKASREKEPVTCVDRNKYFQHGRGLQMSLTLLAGCCPLTSLSLEQKKMKYTYQVGFPGQCFVLGYSFPSAFCTRMSRTGNQSPFC
jgi:hypothetical protein